MSLNTITRFVNVNGKHIIFRLTNQSLLDVSTPDFQLDAIVNAANTEMIGGSGINGAIHAKAGPDLLKELKRLAPNGCRTGELVVTKGYGLAPFIFHTPGPIWKGGGSLERQFLEDSYWNCINEANTRKLNSIGFCSLSTGIYGYPLNEASYVAIRTMLNYIDSVEESSTFHVQTIVFAMYGEQEFLAFRNAFEKILYPWINEKENINKIAQEPDLIDRIKNWLKSWVN